MSVNEKMTAIANAIRAKTKITEALTLDQMATAIPDVYASGEAAALAECQEKHYVTAFTGNGSGEATFDMPFVPDFIAVSNMTAYSIKEIGRILYLLYDVRTVGILAGAGLTITSESGGVKALMMTETKAKSRFNFENGTCTLTDLAEYFFANGEKYIVAAVKYTDKSDKERITEYINALPDSGGSTALSKIKKEANFSDAEWAALIATKPNWTITLS